MGETAPSILQTSNKAAERVVANINIMHKQNSFKNNLGSALSIFLLLLAQYNTKRYSIEERN